MDPSRRNRFGVSNPTRDADPLERPRTRSIPVVGAYCFLSAGLCSESFISSLKTMPWGHKRRQRRMKWCRAVSVEASLTSTELSRMTVAYTLQQKHERTVKSSSILAMLALISFISSRLVEVYFVACAKHNGH